MVMRKIVFGVVFLVMSMVSNLALAQQTVWVQIETQRSLARAQEVARSYSGNLQSVAGFVMRSGWYAIAIGPFSPADAEVALQQLRVTRQIPGDSYVVDGAQFGRQFWPIGATANAPAVVSQVQPTEDVVAQPLIPAEETVAQARRSEWQLNRDQRKELQTALQSEGFYTSAIDGAIGPGTRRSMADWQANEGFEATGVLTTQQRHDLVRRYGDVLAGLGLELFIDNRAGIQIEIPAALVKFDRYDPPFAQFKANNTDGPQILLISQTGDNAALRGLYDIMQTLEIVPMNGQRQIGRRSFTLSGQNTELSSYTFAVLVDGSVKGFTLIWPGTSDRQHAMVLNALQQSFAPFGDAVLPDVVDGGTGAQSLDLLAGLNIRQPDSAASGFYVTSTGSILTAAANVARCTKILIDDDFTADITAVDPNLGFALLQPLRPTSPIAVAQFAIENPRLKSEIAIAGYSFGGLLAAPTLTYGQLSDLRGLNGDASVNRLTITAEQGDSGGPVFSVDGAVLGMLLPAGKSLGRKLPDGVEFAANAASTSDFLTTNAVPVSTYPGGPKLDPEDLSHVAADMTVLVSCWN